jgi:REP element-mobilizing transposase RayT
MGASGRRKNAIWAVDHYVWATHERLPLLDDDIRRPVYRYIERVCLDERCEVLAIGGTADHVHLVVCPGTTVSIARLMQCVKGGSSRFISKELRPGAWFAWQAHFAMFTVSPRDKARVVAYVLNQERHHQSGTLWEEAERTDAEDD